MKMLYSIKMKQDWKDTKRHLLYALSLPSSSPTPNLLLVSLSFLSKETSVKAQVEALLDTGSLAGDNLGENSE